MKIANLSDMFKGWFIGDFEPTVLRTKDFEVGIMYHEKGSAWPTHYHKEATEITLLLSGRMKIQNKIIESGVIFTLEPYEIADPEFLEDCKVLVIKTPSVPGDKYTMENK